MPPLADSLTFPIMEKPRLDFSMLTADERITLAEQLWDSVEPTGPIDGELEGELRQRQAELAADGDLGEPGEQVLDEIATRGR